MFHQIELKFNPLFVSDKMSQKIASEVTSSEVKVAVTIDRKSVSGHL